MLIYFNKKLQDRAFGLFHESLCHRGFLVIFYLMIWRPQAKRAKEQKNLLGSLQKGDEVVTTGGIAGKITKVSDAFVVLEVSDTVEMKFQKGAIAATLPKGTLKAI